MSATPKGKASRIVVGVDGSPASLDALRWSVGQARNTGATVDAVIAWELPVQKSGYGWAPLTIAECAEYEAAARKTVDEAISDVSGPGGPQMTGVVVEGVPAQALLDASAGADLLVVGSRGQGRFADALLGTISHHCFEQARCPVVIMRGEPSAQTAASAA